METLRPQKRPRRILGNAVNLRINKERLMLGTILIVLLILAVLGVLPRWQHSRSWGYYPSGVLGLILVIVVVLVLVGRI